MLLGTQHSLFGIVRKEAQILWVANLGAANKELTMGEHLLSAVLFHIFQGSSLDFLNGHGKAQLYWDLH